MFLQVHQRQIQNPEFLQDIQDLFAERRFGHVGCWRFSEPLYQGDPVNGLKYWNSMVKEAKAAGKYYIFSDEVDLINECARAIGQEVAAPVTLVDLGPGSKEAVIDKIGNLIREIGQPVSGYIGIDIVPEVLESTRSTFKESFPFIDYADLHADFFEQKLPLSASPNVLMVIFGVTLFNLPIDPLQPKLNRMMMVSLLKRMRANLVRDAHFVVTQDCNADLQEIISSYRAQDKVWLNMLQRIIRDLPVSGDFDPEGFSFEPFWVAETCALSHTYVCRKDMDFMIGGESFCLHKGQRFHLHNSYKFPADYFCGLAKQAGFEASFTHINEAGRMALHMLKAV